jgi:Ca2+-transporting ATPase
VDEEPMMGATDTAWHAVGIDEATATLDVDVDEGLTAAEAEQRRATSGPNEIDAADREPFWRAVLRQFENFMSLMLLGAAAASFVVGETSTAIVVLVLVAFNAVLGYRQEAKAEESTAALRDMLEVEARVRRDGSLQRLPARELVPGDIVVIEAGDRVPADGRLFQVATLEVEESALTGESQPVAKDLGPVAAEAALGDRTSVVFMNSLVTRGRGTMVVTNTGMSSEIGQVARMLDEVDSDKSPLQRQMDGLSKVISMMAGTTLGIVVISGLARGGTRDEVLILGTSVALAAIPTGLPTVVTMLLSEGTQQMARQHAIVKHLTSVETLGSTSAICSDKTGTLTVNQMTARVLVHGGERFRVSGEGYSTDGQIMRPAGGPPIDHEPVLSLMALCSDAVARDGELVGDPTEGALVVLAEKGGVDVAATRDLYPRLAEVPFDSAYKLMATFHEMTGDDGRPVIRCCVKGAPTVLLGRSADVAVAGGGTVPAAEAHDRILAENDRLAAEGMRVLCVARRDLDPAGFDGSAELLDYVEDLTLVGMAAIVDPPRPEARDAIATAASAGIRIRMITGDNAVTAGAIGHELGIEGEALTGADLDRMDDGELDGRLDSLGIFGRVAPEHKVRLVQRLQARGEVVAMTGDGVNDAPALKAADIGVAMGITGSEVSKQAAGMILTDDNFASIVRAVHQGRAIYDNLMKYLRFQMVNLMGWVVLFVLASVFDIAGGAPLSPAQILWIKFVIDVPMALALGRDVPAAGLMDKPPRDPDAAILTSERAARWGLGGTVLALLTLVVLEIAPGEAIVGTATVSATMAFAALGLAHVFVALSSRSERRSAFSAHMLDNPKLLRTLAVQALIVVLSVELGFTQRWLENTPLTGGQWGVAVLAASSFLVVSEIRKALARRGSPDIEVLDSDPLPI